jgi:hypothetical protein
MLQKDNTSRLKKNAMYDELQEEANSTADYKQQYGT